MINTDVPTWVPLWFRAASAYGVIILLSSLTDLSPDDPQRFMQIAFVGVAGAFQWIFWIIASDPQRYRAIIPVATFEKIAFGIPAIIFADDLPNASAVGILASIDLLLAVGFISALQRVSPE